MAEWRSEGKHEAYHQESIFKVGIAGIGGQGRLLERAADQEAGGQRFDEPRAIPATLRVCCGSKVGRSPGGTLSGILHFTK
jgi:hypothetical protein